MPETVDLPTALSTVQESEQAGLISPETAERIRVARSRMVAERMRRGRAIDNEAKRTFLSAIAAGLGVDDAADVAQRSLSGLYDARNRDPEFAKAWADAMEASLAPIERRLVEVAEKGSIDSMATVRAAEIMLKHRDPRRYTQGGGASVKMTQGPDGGSLSVRLGTPLPD